MKTENARTAEPEGLPVPIVVAEVCARCSASGRPYKVLGYSFPERCYGCGVCRFTLEYLDSRPGARRN